MDDEQLDLAAYVAWNNGGASLLVARNMAASISRDAAGLRSLASKRTLGRSYLVWAMTFDQDSAYPADSVLEVLQSAVLELPPEEAFFAQWYLAEMHRRRGDFEKDNREYLAAEKLVESIISGPIEAPGYVKALAYREIAVVSLSRRNPTEFERALHDAELEAGLVELAVESLLGRGSLSTERTPPDESAIWPSRAGDWAKSLVSELRLRGLGREALEGNEKEVALAAQTAHETRGHLKFDAVVTPYSHAGAILTSTWATNKTRTLALHKWQEAFALSKRRGDLQQIHSGEQVIRDPRVLIPQEIRYFCRRCRKETTQSYADDVYKCSECRNPGLNLPHNRSDYRTVSF